MININDKNVINFPSFNNFSIKNFHPPYFNKETQDDIKYSIVNSDSKTQHILNKNIFSHFKQYPKENVLFNKNKFCFNQQEKIYGFAEKKEIKLDSNKRFNQREKQESSNKNYTQSKFNINSSGVIQKDSSENDSSVKHSNENFFKQNFFNYKIKPFKCKEMSGSIEFKDVKHTNTLRCKKIQPLTFEEKNSFKNEIKFTPSSFMKPENRGFQENNSYLKNKNISNYLKKTYVNTSIENESQIILSHNLNQMKKKKLDIKNHLQNFHNIKNTKTRDVSFKDTTKDNTLNNISNYIYHKVDQSTNPINIQNELKNSNVKFFNK